MSEGKGICSHFLTVFLTNWQVGESQGKNPLFSDGSMELIDPSSFFRARRDFLPLNFFPQKKTLDSPYVNSCVTLLFSFFSVEQVDS